MKQASWLSCTIAALVLVSGCSGETGDEAHRIPSEYGFPADELTLLRQLDRIDFIGMRRHGWTIWAGLTHQATAADAAVFESWYPAAHVFHESDEPPAHVRSFKTHFEAPNQHRFEAPGESLISHVMYNQAARDHIRENELYVRKTLTDMNDGFDRDETPGWNRTIPQFPRDGIVIKPVWWPIKQNEATVLPVWDGPYEPLDSDGKYPKMPAEEWPNAVLVIPPGVQTPTDPGSVPGTNPGQTVRGTAPIEDFYYFQVTEEMLGHLDSEQEGFEHISAGDYAVLVAMHVTTREIHSWVWATFWWHDRSDLGHLADDRPDSVKDEWAHFLMNVAFSMDTPGAPDAGPHVVYNPYIEGKFPNGAQSNCAACHNRASYPELPGELCGALPITRGSHDYQPTSPERRTRTKLEFLWSILFRSLPAPPACLGSGEA